MLRRRIDSFDKEHVRVLVFSELREAEDGHHIDVCVHDHQADVTHIAAHVDHVPPDLPPEDEVDEDLQDLLQGVQVKHVSLSLDAVHYDTIEALVVDDHLLHDYAW